MITASSRAAAAPTHGFFIDGREVPASSDEPLDVLNPATGRVIARVAHGTARLVNRLADALEAHLPELFQLETQNNGRPVNETRAQINRLPDFFRYNAGLALARRAAGV